jgi:hypothetical protein
MKKIITSVMVLEIAALLTIYFKVFSLLEKWQEFHSHYNEANLSSWLAIFWLILLLTFYSSFIFTARYNEP